ncbi:MULTISPECIES: hypothetical protein [Acinetobacter]|uniref:hypothetical protein n=1 Tax=Acinetobacter TaxID=469 RepID=UPI001FB43278|nr:hypothetical protein [Acinetobacter junii]UOB52922.1 hypothetical protein MRY16_02805 [Acinetobacter junii]
MPWGSNLISNLDNKPHVFRVHEPLDLQAWLGTIATEYVALRSECVIPFTSSLNVAGLGLFDVASIQARIQQACTPSPDLHRGNFSVTRSDLSEVAAYLALEKGFNTQIGFKLTRDRELITLPGRGIDAIGIENIDKQNGDKLVVVLTEVKFSNEKSGKKPPQVVDSKSKDDCMSKQHKEHIKNLKITANKLIECSRKTKDENLRDQYLIAGICLGEDDWEQYIDLVSCCILVRPKEHHTVVDFGSFYESPSDFAPANIRFIVISLPEKIEKIMNDWSAKIEEIRGPSL